MFKKLLVALIICFSLSNIGHSYDDRPYRWYPVRSGEILTGNYGEKIQIINPDEDFIAAQTLKIIDLNTKGQLTFFTPSKSNSDERTHYFTWAGAINNKSFWIIEAGRTFAGETISVISYDVRDNFWIVGIDKNKKLKIYLTKKDLIKAGFIKDICASIAFYRAKIFYDDNEAEEVIWAWSSTPSNPTVLIGYNYEKDELSYFIDIGNNTIGVHESFSGPLTIYKQVNREYVKINEKHSRNNR